MGQIQISDQTQTPLKLTPYIEPYKSLLKVLATDRHTMLILYGHTSVLNYRESGKGDNASMICRAMVPNYPTCGNNSIYPSPKTANLPFSVSIGHQRRVSTAWLRPNLLSRQRASRSDSRPPAAAGDVGAIGELSPATENFYELLGIPVSGSHDDIKRAYKQLARKYHPDVSPPDRAEEYTHRFILVQEAYETLSDPECRALYDRSLARGLHFAFSARRQFDEELEKKSGWKNRWQDQLVELRRRSAIKNSDDNLSWGARMRKRRAD